MATPDEALAALHALSDAEQLAGMARYGMSLEGRLGIKMPELRRLAKQLGRDHELALGLWESGIAEARILASMVDMASAVTAAQMDAWVKDLDSWDVCDQLCMNLFDKSPLAWEKVREWAGREPEFEKRAAYSLIACLAWHDKNAEDARFVALLPLIVEGATDERNFVKKAVSWALRHIGKRSATLREAALATAAELRAMDSKAARWIANDAVRDLNSATTLRRLGSQ